MSGIASRMSSWFASLSAPAGDVLPVRLGMSRRAATGTQPSGNTGFDQPLVKGCACWAV